MAKLYFLALTLLLGTLICQATPSTRATSLKPDKINSFENSKLETMSLPTNEQQVWYSESIELPKKLSPNKEGRETYKVTLKQVYDPEIYASREWIRMAGEDFYDYKFVDGTSDYTVTVNLPEGEYAFISDFDVIDDAVPVAYIRNIAYIVLEVSVTSDMTIEFRPEEATNLITCESVNPNGEIPTLPTTLTSQEYPKGIKIDGNTSELHIFTTFASKRFGSLFINRTGANFGKIYYDSEFNVSRVADISINDVSDDICITQSRVASDNEGFYFSFMKPIYGVTESCNGEYSSDYSISYNEDYLNSIISTNTQAYLPKPYQLTTFIKLDNNAYSTLESSTDGLVQIAGASYIPDKYEVEFQMDYIEFTTPVFDQETEIPIGLIHYPIKSMPVYLSPDGTLRRTYEHVSDYDSHETIHPFLSYDLPQCLTLQGSTQPSILFYSRLEYSWDNQSWEWWVDPLAIGRLGELRYSDFASMTSSYKYENADFYTQRVTTSNVNIYDNADGTGYSFPGLTTASFTINPTVSIEPPIVQQVQFRNSKDQITERFESPEDGNLLIVAEAYTQYTNRDEGIGYDEPIWWFESGKVDIEVACSPMGENTWEELDMADLGDYFFVSQFGYLYTATLRDVTAKSPTGWYDLRINLTDADGDTQTQVISPAFRIGDPASVKAVNSDSYRLLQSADSIIVVGDNNASIVITGLNGQVVATGNGSVSTSNLPTGLYIVSATSSTGKTTKKIHI